MDKRQVAEAVWSAGPARHEIDVKQARRRGSQKSADYPRSDYPRPDYLRMVPLQEREGTMAEAWLNKGLSGANSNPPPSIHASAYADAIKRDPEPQAGPQTIPHHAPDTIIRPWSSLLERALESEIFPRLLAAQRTGKHAAEPALPDGGPSAGEINGLVNLLLADDVAQARILVRQVLARGVGRTTLLDDLFSPAARRLGDLWDQDICDFSAVTLGIIRLDQMMHETETSEPECHGFRGHDRRALLTPVPGDQHSFGIGVVADAFRGGGWHVWSGRAATRPELLRLVRRESFHVIGFSSTNQRLVGQLPSCIRAVRRASRNRDIRVMVGGKYFLDHPDQVAVIGADAMAVDARDALKQADGLIAALAGINGHVSTHASIQTSR